MKRLTVFLLTIVCLCVSCKKKDDVRNGYTDEVKAVLNVLNGSWRSENKHDPEELTFTLFGRTIEKNGGIAGVMYFHGKATRKFTYLDGKEETWNMYFYVNTEKKEIVMYGINDDGTFDIVRSTTYSYSITDNNNIELHDKSLSWIHVYNYKRI